MITYNKLIALILLALIACGLLAGCSMDSDGSDPSQPEPGGFGMTYGGKPGINMGGGVVMGYDGKIGMGYGF